MKKKQYESRINNLKNHINYDFLNYNFFID